MAQKFVNLEEAARMLGVTPDDLSAMRERQEIRAFRDGGNWKFRAKDVEQLAASASAGDDPDSAGEGTDDILLSDVALGKSAGGSSTIIGKDSAAAGKSDSDLQLGSEKPDTPAGQGSDVRLVPTDDITPGGSDVKLVAEDASSPSAADPAASDSFSDDLLIPADDEFAVLEESSSVSGADSSGDSASDADVTIDAVEGDVESSATSGSSEVFDVALDEEMLSGERQDIPLKGESKADADMPLSDEDSVFSGDESSGEVTLDGPGSGISLAEPGTDELILGEAEDGLSLAESYESTGASAGSPHDSSSSSSEDLSFEDDSDSELVTGMADADSEFLLTPFEETGDASSEDSGSQVIALDTDAEFDDAADALATAASDAGPLASEDFAPTDDAAAALADASAVAAAAAAPMVIPAGREVPYTTLNVVSLGACAFVLLLAGVMTLDILQNMWSWNEPYSVNSFLMDNILGIFGG